MVEHEPVEEVESEGSDEDDESEGKNKIPATPVEDVVISTYEIKAEPRLTCVSAWVQGEKKTSGKKGVYCLVSYVYVEGSMANIYRL
jgi:hypothetical protein